MTAEQKAAVAEAERLHARREWKVCAACDGRGHVFGYHGDYMTCTACKATGRIRLTPPKPRRKAK